MKQKLLFFLTIAFLSAAPLFAQSAWPQNVSISEGGKLTMYEPQPESLSGNQLKGRAAVSVRKTGSDEPVFGVIFFTATLQNNGSGKEISSMRITQAKFSGIEDQDQVDKYSSLLEKNAAGWNLGMSENELREAVARENNTAKGDDFNNAAPKIIYSDKPSTLIVLDGEPKVLHDKNIDADKVANSPNLIFKEGNQWNLYAGGNWYSSSSVIGGWKINNQLSKKVKTVNDAVKKQEKENNKGENPTGTPRLTDIIVATEPTELLQTDGEPEFKAVAGTSLLYVSNSPNEIFKDINTQKTYILIAGRWYNSSDINGPWTYVPADRLPEDFAKIPEGSDKDNVLANVAGTEAAEDALVDAAVPQTAKVNKKTATIEVEYDGTPVFNPIEGTSLMLADNANLTVMIDASGKYFALDNGVWFSGNSAYGPWKVANDRPRDIDDIPANSPAYNSKYVYIYDETPDYVYMGYTSGYLGSYYYGPTIVYGTGWHYRPWYRTMYYPRPITWGFGFMYDPWIGWGINWGYNFGFLYVGFDYGGYGYGRYGYGYGGGWFGPRYYCPAYRSPYYGGYYGGYGNYYGYNSYRRNDYYGYNSRTDRNVNGNGSRPNRRLSSTSPNQNPGSGSGSGWTRNYNLYNRQNGVVTQNVNRSPRVYRPDVAISSNRNVSSLVNDRYSNRLQSRPDRNATVGNNSTNNNSNVETDNNINRSPRNNNPREPIITRPERREPIINRPDNNNSNTPTDNNVDRTPRNNNPREPIINRPERKEPIINRPDNNNSNTPTDNNVERTPGNSNPREPIINRPERREPIINRPDNNSNRENNGVSERERPIINRPAPVERERPAQVERPQRAERSLPPPRSAPERQSSPPVRQSAPERQSAPRGGGSSGGGIHERRGGRPGR